MAVYRSLPVFLAIFLIGLSFSTTSVVHLRKYNSVLHQVEDRVRSPKGPGKQGAPGDHGILVGPGGPPVGPGGFGPGVPGANDTSGIIFGPEEPGFPPISPTGEKCVSMCEKLKALIESLETNMTEPMANGTDPEIPSLVFFVFLFCSNSTADGPMDQIYPGKSEESSEESGESEESSEESGESEESFEESVESEQSSEESGESEESSEESGDSEDSIVSSGDDSDDDAVSWISWDQLETKRHGRPGHFQKVCEAYQRLMNLQSIRQTMHNGTLFNQSGPLQPVMGYVHDVCQKDGSEGEGNDGGDDDNDDDSDDDGDRRMIRRGGPHHHNGKDSKFDSWEGPPGPMGDPIAEFCQIISIVSQQMGGNVTVPDGPEEVKAFFKDMVSCLCNVDLNI